MLQGLQRFLALFLSHTPFYRDIGAGAGFNTAFATKAVRNAISYATIYPEKNACAGTLLLVATLRENTIWAPGSRRSVGTAERLGG